MGNINRKENQMQKITKIKLPKLEMNKNEHKRPRSKIVVLIKNNLLCKISPKIKIKQFTKHKYEINKFNCNIKKINCENVRTNEKIRILETVLNGLLTLSR